MSREAMAVCTAIVVAVASAAGAQSAAPAALRKQLVHRLEHIASNVDGLVGYTVLDLTTGDRIERLATTAFPAASSIKLAILYELFRQADERRLNLDSPVPWNARRAVGGSGVLAELSNPVLSLRDYATLMIVLSDNTAANVIIEAVGIDRVNARMQSLGLPDVRLRRVMMDLEAARKGNENLATPGSLADLLGRIEKGEGLTGASRDALLAILKKPKSSPLSRAIPSSVAVASKPGDLDGVRADAGIVYLKDRSFILAVMTSWLRNDDEGERAIEEISRTAFEYFRRLAASSEYGRRVR